PRCASGSVASTPRTRSTARPGWSSNACRACGNRANICICKHSGTKGCRVLDLAQYVPYLLNRAGRRVADAFTRELGGFGVTLPMWRVMASLRSEGPQRLGDLSELTAIAASTLSRLLGQMQEKGPVRRRSEERRVGNACTSRR